MEILKNPFNIRISRLKDDLQQFNKFTVYGIGKVTESIMPYMEDLLPKIDAFLVTNASDTNIFYDKPVVQLSEYNNLDMPVLIATTEIHANEIATNLKNNGYKRFIFVCEYFRKYDINAYKIFSDASEEEFFRYIAEWRIEADGELGKFEKKLADIRAYREVNRPQENKIVVLTDTIKARILKIIKALAQKGISVSVIKVHHSEYAGDRELSKIEGVTIKICNCIEDCLYEALSSNPMAYWLDCPWANPSVPAIIIRFKNILGKTIFAPYDLLNEGFYGYPKEIYQMEKYCLENADGVVWRYFAKNYFEEKLKFNMKGKQFLLSDICEDRKLTSKKNDDTLKLCCIANHVIYHLCTNENKYIRPVLFTEILDKIKGREDCIFHFYTWNASNEEERLLAELKQKYDNFSYFIHVDHEELMNKLTKYDYAVEIMKGNKIPCAPNYADFGDSKADKVGEVVLRFASCNKFFEFLEAGLPIVSTFSSQLTRELSEQGVLVPMDLDNFDIDVLKEKKGSFTVAINNAKQKYNIENKIYEIINFIETL